MSVVISLTTIPTRLHKIEPCINSLKKQGFKVYLWIPEIFKRKNIKFDGKIPKFLKDRNIKYDVVEDMGPITKLIPALSLNYDTIITADDDNIYAANWAKRLVNYSNKFSKAALCYRGRIFKFPEKKAYQKTKVIQDVERPTKVDIITGVRGALYKKHFFDKSIYNFTEYPEAFFVDDIWISGKLAKNKIDRICIPGVSTKVSHELKSIDGLYKINWKREEINGKKSPAQYNNNKIIHHFAKHW